MIKIVYYFDSNINYINTDDNYITCFRNMLWLNLESSNTFRGRSEGHLREVVLVPYVIIEEFLLINSRVGRRRK